MWHKKHKIGKNAKTVSCVLVLNLALAPSWVLTGHLLKIKGVDSMVNVHILASTLKCSIYTHDGASAKFITNSHVSDNSVNIYWDSSNNVKATGAQNKRNKKWTQWRRY